MVFSTRRKKLEEDITALINTFIDIGSVIEIYIQQNFKITVVEAHGRYGTLSEAFKKIGEESRESKNETPPLLEPEV